jgi:acetyl esterase/lipase
MSMVAPELRSTLRRFPTVPVDRGWVRRLARYGMRILPTVDTPGVTVEAAGVVRGTRLYRPSDRRTDAALLWIHGGGLVMGGAVQDDRLCGSTARELGIVVLSVEYRLAPEHPYPAALDDCHAGWMWLRDHAAELGVDPARVVIGGQSAGGGLAAALVQRLHDSPGTQPLGQWLFCPMLDDRTAARSELDAVRHRIWSNRSNRYGWKVYLGAAPGAPDVASYAVPARRTDLSGLPPAWIGVGDIDLFHDEDRDYAERLRAAGVATTFHVVPGAPHGFESWAPKTAISRGHVAAALAWLRDVLTD